MESGKKGPVEADRPLRTNVSYMLGVPAIWRLLVTEKTPGTELARM